MPSLADLRTQFAPYTSVREETTEFEEVLITDARGALSPAQMVELKLRSALHVRASSPAGLATSDGKQWASK